MSSVHHLREFISGRLTAAAAEIFSEFEKTILRYEEEMERQRRLLDLCWKPELKLHRVDLTQEWVQKMDLILTNQQPSVDQEEPGPPELRIVQTRGGWTGPELPQTEEQMEPELPQIKKEQRNPEPADFEDLKDPEPADFEDLKDPEPAEFEDLKDPEPVEFEDQMELELSQIKKEREDLEPVEFEEDQELCTIQDQLHLNQWTHQILKEESEPEPDVERLTSQSSAGHEDEDWGPMTKKNHHESGSGPPAGVSMSRTPGSSKRCVLCGRGYKRWRQLSAHYKAHRRQGQLVGDISVKTLRDKFQCVAGTSTAAGEIRDADRPQLLCTICGLNLPNPSKLASHVRSHSVAYVCQTCGKGFPATEALELHSQSHVAEDKMADVQLHQCPTCRKVYTCRSSLTVHMRVHTGEKPYSCQICGEKFAYTQILKSHVKKHNGEKNGKDMDKREHLCPFCDKAFTNGSNLVIHVRSHTGEKPFTCSVCGKKFISKGSLKLHLMIHTGEKPYSCQICGEAFMYKSQLNAHMKAHEN